MRLFLLLPSIFFIGLYVNFAQAYTCTTTTAATTISPPAIVIQRDLPVGSLIGSQITSGAVNTFNCTNTAPALTYQSVGVKGTGNYVTTIGGRRIYSTNIAGIGFAIGAISVNNCNNFSGWVDGTGTGDGNANNRLLCSVNGLMAGQPLREQALLQFYKTGPTGSGMVAAQEAGAFILRNNQALWHSPGSTILMNGFSVTTLACSVSNTAIAVNMGNVDKRAFNGTGSSPDASFTRNFTLPLNCNAGTRINVKIDGNAQNSANGVLNLTSGANTASGVGVQLLFNNAPVQLGTNIVAGTSASAGNYNIPLQARYYQTTATITPGTANSSATFTLTYQ
ncbi:fimbrial protein [Pantoea sp. DY-17]|uniref:fimbrial protein n=1 Tax=Pantoea sp. DY-17 TaxID=2871490 RepID=UPI001C9833CE|nr:fimbrial protein [Pantoea sp. DY-17]MBY4953179.1 type 1 fimbrial protein [Pantoea sp. DY-17]